MFARIMIFGAHISIISIALTTAFMSSSPSQTTDFGGEHSLSTRSALAESTRLA